jgi:O-antigen/teichoic acid export membrane protein
MGIYVIASRIPGLLDIILKALNGDMSAQISKLYYNSQIIELNIFIQKYIKFGFLISMLMVLFTFFCGKNILSIWGQDFRSGQTIFLLLMISQGINLSTIGSSMTLTLCGLQRKMRDVTIVGIVLKIILMTLLMHQFGINGLAMAILFHSFGINIYKIYLNKKHLNLKFYPQLI